MRVYIGTQCTADGQGVFAASFDDETGELVSRGAVATVERPTCVLADVTRSVLYAVSEIGNDGGRSAEVLSFAIEGDDDALPMISRTFSGGGGATHLALAPNGKHLFVANFGGGEVATLPVGADGALGAPLSVRTTYGSGPHRRQTGPHAHGVTLDPSQRYLLVSDMGADRLFVYHYDAATGGLHPAEPAYLALPAGVGPRLVLFGQDGRFAYMLSELSAEIFVFRWRDSEGRLEPLGSVALDASGVDDRSAAAFCLSDDGGFLYASNRRTGMMHVYAVDSQTGRLDDIEQIAAEGVRPWSAAFSPGGRWLLVANQGSDSVAVFAVDRRTGRLSFTGHALSVPKPTDLTFAR